MLSSDHASAVENISRANELVTQLRALLLPCSPPSSSSRIRNSCTSDLAGDLFEETLRSLTSALFDLRSMPSLRSDHPSYNQQNQRKRKKTAEKKEPNYMRGKHQLESWTTVTSVPHDDGRLWRKYGQKWISKEKFLRNYYRCSYFGDLKCPARKIVQQKDDSEYRPKFAVTYIMKHTCNATPSVADNASVTTSVSSIESKPLVVDHQTDQDGNSSIEIDSVAELHDAAAFGGGWDISEWPASDDSVYPLTDHLGSWEGGVEWPTSDGSSIWDYSAFDHCPSNSLALW